MNIFSFSIALLVGAVTGIMSGLGSGGGTLLIIFMTLFLKTPQLEAQGINLLYFLCCGAPAAYMHKKNGQVNVKYALAAIIPGCAAAAVSSFAANNIDVSTLRFMFAALLIILGIKELFTTSKHDRFLHDIMFPPDEARDNPDNSAK